MIYEREFMKALEREDDVDKISKDYKNIPVPSDYKGPVIENEEVPISPEWCI
jgi:hypothetical protein